MSAVAFVDPYGLLVSADMGGRLCVWPVRPEYPRNRVAATFLNIEPAMGSMYPAGAMTDAITYAVAAILPPRSAIACL